MICLNLELSIAFFVKFQYYSIVYLFLKTEKTYSKKLKFREGNSLES